MAIAAIIARYLLGVMFLVFGLNGFLHFIPLPPPAAPSALQYMTVMSTSGYFVAVYVVEVLVGVLLLANLLVPFALTLLAALLFNILAYHITMDPGGIGAGLVAAVLWVILFLRNKDAFSGLFQPGV